MIYKIVSIKRVISKVFTDLDLQEGTHRISDMIEWAGEALEKIGAFPSFINKVCGKDGLPLLTVSNYQSRLPSDFYRLIQVSFAYNENGPFYPMRYATGSFDFGNVMTSSTVGNSEDVQHPESALVSLAMDLYNLSYSEALAKLNSEPNTRSLINSLVSQYINLRSSDGYGDNMNQTDDITYTIVNSYIKTNKASGYLMVAYQAIPTDNEGYPLIPDDASFMEAIYWYIVMKLLYPQWKQGSIRDAVYYDARRSWNYYCKQAYGNALMPNKDQLESIKNTWLRLIPEIDEHSSGFSTLGQQQIIYNN